MHTSPTNSKLQKESTQRLLKAKYFTVDDQKDYQVEIKNKPNSKFKSRNYVNKVNKTVSTFERFYDSQMDFQKRKFSKMQQSAFTKYIQEEQEIKKMR
jgi:hypothetical protein